MFGMHIDGLGFVLIISAVIAVFLGVRWLIRRFSIHAGSVVRPKAGLWDGTTSGIAYGLLYTVDYRGGGQISLVGLQGSFPIKFFERA